MQTGIARSLLIAPDVLKNEDLRGEEIYLAEYRLTIPTTINKPTFSQFPELPAELQDQIFKLHLPDPRIVNVSTEYNAKGDFLRAKFGVHPNPTALLPRSASTGSLGDPQVDQNLATAYPTLGKDFVLAFEHKEWDMTLGTGDTSKISRLVTNMQNLKTITTATNTWRYEALPAHDPHSTTHPDIIENTMVEGWIGKWKTQQDKNDRIVAELLEIERLQDALVKVQGPKVLFEKEKVMLLKANAGYLTMKKNPGWLR
ncbi:uncharacterized protein PAC_02446 [Phialocephala subalpina]|uniref:2EXR domain-containing protein n=1 Tax=Phialocephala subalpina TaxID=576137 RepID=A0A1L7WII1_9HELO|nr:uncharacterized protein PAC_02446 [Phialocephala subalpina]